MEQDRAMGFCLFNNVAVAARYALKELGYKRILIFDWDLHHGNGTQHSFYDSDKVLYISSHQYPYYPGTGAALEVGKGAGQGFTLNVPLPGGQGDEEFARIVNELVVPVATQYEPQLILVSAGFDIYDGDPLGAMRVTPTGFAYMTRVLRHLAEALCEGKVLVTMEGGYNLTGMREGALAVLAELIGPEANVQYEHPLTDAKAQALKDTSCPLPPLDQALSVAKSFWKI
jgi:acetoin utilization deacetylase AcuC-like enzyme